MIIDTAPLWRSTFARKTKGMKATPLDYEVASHIAPYLRIATREGYIPVDKRLVLCIGVDDEPWAQTPEKIRADYDYVGNDGEGLWHIYQPKANKIVEFFELTQEILDELNIPPATRKYIVGLWGETVDGTSNLQRVHLGDFVVRRPDDHTDQRVVQRSIWFRTYTEVEPPPETV